MTADERIEKLLNAFGTTIEDLPATKDNNWSGPGYAIDHLKAAKKAAYVWMWEEYEDADVIPIDEIEPPLLDYICHLADVIDRMEIALETAQRGMICSSCINFPICEESAANDVAWDCENYKVDIDWMLWQDDKDKDIYEVRNGRRND